VVGATKLEISATVDLIKLSDGATGPTILMLYQNGRTNKFSIFKISSVTENNN